MEPRNQVLCPKTMSHKNNIWFFFLSFLLFTVTLCITVAWFSVANWLFLRLRSKRESFLWVFVWQTSCHVCQERGDIVKLPVHSVPKWNSWLGVSHKAIGSLDRHCPFLPVLCCGVDSQSPPSKRKNDEFIHWLTPGPNDSWVVGCNSWDHTMVGWSLIS